MSELWTVSFDCSLAREKGKTNIIVQGKIKDFVAAHSLTDVLAVNMKDRLMALRVGFCSAAASTSTDNDPPSQWKSEKRPSRPLQDVAKEFRVNLKELLPSEKSAGETLAPAADSSPQQEHNATGSSPSPPSPPPHLNLKDFLSKILVQT